MSDSVSVFAEHAHEYDAQRRRLVPSFDLFYGTAVDLLGLRGGTDPPRARPRRGHGLMSAAVLRRYPNAELVLLDGAAEMLDARARAPAGSSTATVVADLRDELPEGPFDAVVSALAIHHLEHADKRDLFARVASGCCGPEGVFVNAEHVAGPSPWLEATYRRLWREACAAAGASEEEIAGAEARMEMDRSIDIATQLGWMDEAGLQHCDCFFKHLHFAVLAGWRG